MKQVWMMVLLGMGLLVGHVFGAESIAVKVSDLSLEGEILGENIVFVLKFTGSVEDDKATLPLVIGDVAYMESEFPWWAELKRIANCYFLAFERERESAMMFTFASRPLKEKEWRRTTFELPASSIRKISVVCDRNDLEIKFPGALKVEEKVNKDGKKLVTAFLGLQKKVEVRWKPEVRKLDADLVATCDANTIAAASVGAMRLDTIFTYRVIQGTLSKLELEIPDVSVTQVGGEDIQDWTVDKTDPKHPKLVVTLSRPKESTYRLQVESEMILSKFPTKSILPVIRPLGVIRASGFLMVGTDSAIKLQVSKAAGLTQVDQAAFPSVTLMSGRKPILRARPKQATYAYQYANMPYSLEMRADDIVTSLTAEDRLVLRLLENELVFDASVTMDIKDAPAREIVIETDADSAWTVVSVSGSHVSESDTDVREEDGTRLIYVPFTKALRGQGLVRVRMERALDAGAAGFKTPMFRVRGAKSERGWLTIAAELGIQLSVKGEPVGMRDIHTGSVPVSVPGAQHAFLFKKPGWSAGVEIKRTPSAIYTEVFHLHSVAEGVMYASSTINYHIEGAPVQEFQVRVPTGAKTVEFTGADIEGWTREGDVYTVRVQTRIIGDYTLLVTYDTQYDYKGAAVTVGAIETVDTETEIGYIAVASPLSLSVEDVETDKRSKMVRSIPGDEVPSGYAALLTDPIVKAFRYVRTRAGESHAVRLKIMPYDTEPLLGHISDYVWLETRILKDGDAKTAVTFHVKNMSEQYLVVKLPDGAKLRHTKYVDKKGNERRVDSQETAGGREILIPLVRPKDPDTPLRVRVEYDQKLSELGFWRSGVRRLTLVAPMLPDTDAPFARWRVVVPKEFAIAKSGGNITSGPEMDSEGLRGVIRKTVRYFRAVYRDDYTVKQAWNGGFGGVQAATYGKAVTLSGAEPMRIDLCVVPHWVGSGGAPATLLLVGSAGLVVFLVGVAVKRKPVVFALGLALLAYGFAQSAMGRSLVAVGVALVVMAVFLYLSVRFMCPLLWHLGKAGCRLGAAVARAAGRGLKRGWQSYRGWQEQRHEQRMQLRMASAGMASSAESPFESAGEASVSHRETVASEQDDSDGGWIRIRMLGLLLFAGLLVGSGVAQAARRETRAPAPVVPTMSEMHVDIVGPGTSREIEQSATVTSTFTFEVKKPTSFTVVSSSCVLTDYALSSKRYLSVKAQMGKKGYVLNVGRRGTYTVTVTYQAPVQERNGVWNMSALMLPNMKNAVTLKLPDNDLDVESSTAVFFNALARAEGKGTVARAVFGPAETAEFSWKPRVRKVKFEEAMFFCEVNTLATLRAGVVELVNAVRYQVAQGEVKDLTFVVPEGMSVTAVRAPAPGLATWSFDPTTRRLEAILEKAVSGEYSLIVVTQVASEGLPYRAKLGSLWVQGAARQRGAIALAAADTIQVRVGDVTGLNPMNIEDFPSSLAGSMGKGTSVRVMRTRVRKAFRYHEAKDVAVTVHTDEVLPEIRVIESSKLDLQTERMSLTSTIQLKIAKAGVFSVELSVPDGYDIETLQGKDVSHWDEVGENSRTNRGVIVHFARHVGDGTVMTLVMARTERGIDARMDVPRVVVKDAKKHHGRLQVHGEPGIRIMIDRHRGVDVKKASDVGIRQPGVLVFDILRPSWLVALKTDVLEPVVKPDVLQVVDLTEGMLKCRAYVRYKIENAGVKSFLLQAPVPGVRLSVTGKNVANVKAVDEGKGIWRVDLHTKVRKDFAVDVTYQIPCVAANQQVKILPLRTLDTDGQQGFVVVTGGGRVRVKPAGTPVGLKVDDPRQIPKKFSAGDLSGAILCYRAVRPDYELTLSAVKHGRAEQLKADIKNVGIVSLMSDTGRMVTHVNLSMRVGSLRELEVSLPNGSDALWTAMVNRKQVASSRQGTVYRIPLQQSGGQDVSVELVYVGASQTSGMGMRHTIQAPKFGLPLNNVEWKLYAPARNRYFGFDGTMDAKDVEKAQVVTFTPEVYVAYNDERRKKNLKKADDLLNTQVSKFRQTGQQKEAQQALEQALNYSLGQEDLNEDARVQLRSLRKQQFKMGLVNRRDNVRYGRNVIDDAQLNRLKGFQDGGFTEDYVVRVERDLGKRGNKGLDVVVAKLLDQQTAVEGVVQAMGITMPTEGKELIFERAQHVQEDEHLDVSFVMSSGAVTRNANALYPAVAMFLVMWTALSVMRRKMA